MALLRLDPCFVDGNRGVVEHCRELIQRIGVAGGEAEAIAAEEESRAHRIALND